MNFPTNQARTHENLALDEASANEPSRKSFLPSGAIQLDHNGRLLHPALVVENDASDSREKTAATSFFVQNCPAVLLEQLERFFQRGQLDGFLYQFIDVTLACADGPREMTLLLYYHASTQAAWIFIEPKEGAEKAASGPICSAA